MTKRNIIIGIAALLAVVATFLVRFCETIWGKAFISTSLQNQIILK